MNPYSSFVSDLAALVEKARGFPLGGFESPAPPPLAPGAPKALFFAPHPDDECITGGPALRLLREAGMEVFNIAVTLGSRKDRQAGRLAELQNACRYLGFKLQTAGPAGLERVNAKTRAQEPAHWRACVKIIAGLLDAHRPRVIICPHERDWNSTHIGTHLLVMDALNELGGGFGCHVLETEFWGALDDPNVMFEISTADLADMIAATTFHIGEVERNPYHLLLPGWMMDNIRRGGELVGGQGGAAPSFAFAVLGRWRGWSDGRLTRTFQGGRMIPRTANLAELFS